MRYVEFWDKFVCSPRMWRWSWTPEPSILSNKVFSTYVEMILLIWACAAVGPSVLHVCGDDPIHSTCTAMTSKCSPRMWRWSYSSIIAGSRKRVFSTYVEMILWKLLSNSRHLGVLHVCGDDPNVVQTLRVIARCSPRMWRWSPLNRHFFTIITVFSTYVEMILLPPIVSSYWGGVLHVCGDDPKLIGISNLEPMCSPRMWRWSFCKTNQKLETQVFSTYVEMIPANTI